MSVSDDKNKKNKVQGYHDTGIDEDAAMTATTVGRMATAVIPGGKVVQGGVDATLAAVQGDIEATKDEKRLRDAGIDTRSEHVKWNPRIKTHMEKVGTRWRGRAGEAVVSAGGAAAGGAAGVGLATAMGVAGGFVVPVIGAPIGAAIGGAAGTLIGGYAGSKAYNTVLPMDEKDEVDLTLKIVEAQKQGMEIPPEAIFAQWAAQQKGSMDKKLKSDLKAATGLTNFNDAIEQGRLAELTAMMNKREYSDAMRTYMGVLPDTQNPDRHVADQLAEWATNGGLQGKDLLLGHSHTPIMSLADAQREGYTSDPLMAPSMELPNQRADRSNTLAV